MVGRQAGLPAPWGGSLREGRGPPAGLSLYPPHRPGERGWQVTRHFLVQLIPSNRSQELKIHACAESTTHPARPSWPLCLMRPLLPKVRQDLGDTVTDRGWDGTDQGGRRPGSLWTPPQLPPGISSCLKPQRVFIRRPNRPEARLSALGSPTAVAWQEPKHSGLPAPGAGRPCSPEQWPLLVEGSVPPQGPAR